MADGTKIEWADATVNAINGCSVTSPGCKHCYAMKQAHRVAARRGLTQKTSGGMVWTGEVRLHEKALLKPLRWRRPRRIFWNAHGDIFHDAVPDEWIDRVFAVAALTPQHTHMILTKRSKRMREYMSDSEAARRVWDVASESNRILMSLAAHGAAWGGAAPWPLRNVWLGVSVEDQTRADERIPYLLDTPADVRFLSCEPLLGPVDLQEWLICANARDGLSMDPSTGAYECCRQCDYTGLAGGIDWVIAGGESGPGARPMHPDWARSLRDQCAAADVPFHFKQWGEWNFTQAVENSHGGVDFEPEPPMSINMMRWRKWEADEARSPHKGESVGEWFTPAVYSVPVGKKRAGRLLDGVEHNGVPQVQYG